MDNKKQQAQRGYMEGKTQKEIADIVGVSERTVHSWIHQYAWDKLRLASYQAPVTIADNLCSQLIELQNAIAAREPGKRYPTPDEAEITRKLIVSLERMKKYPSMSQSMQVLETFRNYIRPVDKDFARSLGNYTERFLNGKAINGFSPYQVEYCVNPISPIDSFYEEDEAEETGSKTEVPCPDINTCLHEGNCTYPHCQHPGRYTPQPTPETLYAVPPINYEHATVNPVILSSPKNELQHAESSSIPAEPVIVSAQYIDQEHLADCRDGVLPVSHMDGPEKTRSIPAIAQPKNLKNIRIAVPNSNRNSNHRHHADKLEL